MPSRKRSAPDALDAADNGRRRSGRLSSTSLKKSKYFEDSSDGSEGNAPPKKRGRPTKKTTKKEIEESEDLYQDQSDQDGEVQEDDDEAEEEEDDDDDDDDESKPMKVTILPLEKMRDTGGVEYEDSKLHKNSLLFLKDLKANNQRSWLKSHDGEYRRALKDWQSFVEAATMTVIDVDETIPELPVKDVIFRIHRDIRFSKDPTPYKPHFSAAWSRTGRKGPYACYYIHCEPRASFIGGGLWCPERDHLARLRSSIDRHPRRWRRALNNQTFRDVFFPAVKPSTGEDGVVDAFAERNKDTALKKRPQGYDMEHRDIRLLRLRNFVVGKNIDDTLLCRDDAQEKVAEVLRGLEPFVTFLNSIVMPDPSLDNDDSSSEEGEGDDGEDED